jgi:hypothetical protein
MTIAKLKEEMWLNLIAINFLFLFFVLPPLMIGIAIGMVLKMYLALNEHIFVGQLYMWESIAISILVYNGSLILWFIARRFFPKKFKLPKQHNV